jgi:hypothetical protein
MRRSSEMKNDEENREIWFVKKMVNKEGFVFYYQLLFVSVSFLNLVLFCFFIVFEMVAFVKNSPILK